MYKSDLKENYIVRVREGDYYMIKTLTTGERILFGKQGWVQLDRYNEDLTFNDWLYIELDIVEVLMSDGYNFETLFNENWMTSIWKREGSNYIEWTKVPAGTRVQIRTTDDGEWANAYFVGYRIGKNNPYCVAWFLYDKFTNTKPNNLYAPLCRLHPSVTIKEEWLREEELCEEKY